MIKKKRLNIPGVEIKSSNFIPKVIVLEDSEMITLTYGNYWDKIALVQPDATWEDIKDLNIVIWPIKLFSANRRPIDPYKMYPKEGEKKGYNIAFLANDDERYLLVVGTKTPEDFKFVGADRYLRTEIPVLINAVNQQFNAVNLQSSSHPGGERYGKQEKATDKQ